MLSYTGSSPTSEDPPQLDEAKFSNVAISPKLPCSISTLIVVRTDGLEKSGDGVWGLGVGVVIVSRVAKHQGSPPELIPLAGGPSSWG